MTIRDPSLGLRRLLGERAVLPGEPTYDQVRRVHNGLIDKRPALVARCLDATEVAAALNVGRDAGLEISVRGGGHNVAGRAVTEGGLMIDLSLMKRVIVDPGRALASAEPGTCWRELNAATQAHALAVTGGTISTTGIAGLTLGGGLGWLMSKYGLAADNLVEAEVVTAAGEVLNASTDENPDLFWGLRGGGGNFGVVTKFHYALHTVGPTITGGYIFYPYKKAAEVLRLFRDLSSALSDDMSTVLALIRSPQEPRELLAGIIVCHVGSENQAERDIAPLRNIGTPALDAIIRKSYCDVNAQFDFGFPNGALNYWKSSFLKGLPEAAIETMVARFVQAPSPMTVLLIEDIHGQVTRVPVNATAIPHRAKGFNLLIASVWLDRSRTQANIDWTRHIFDELAPHLATGRYVNYLDDDEGLRYQDPVRAAYGPNYDRLVELKTKYDPDNVFHLNQNILPR